MAITIICNRCNKEIKLVNTAEYAKIVGRSQGDVKRNCRLELIDARKVGRDWIMFVPEKDALIEIKARSILEKMRAK